jgi:CBS domain-containing protein
MSSHHLSPPRGSYRAPGLEHALVEDVMRPGIISCGPETDLTTVARTMAANHVHAVVVSGIEPTPHGGEHLSWGLITALDLVAAALPGVGMADAGALASTEIITVDAREPLERAAQLMVEHQLTHLLVIAGARPIGVVSTLDIAGCLAWGDA